MENLVKVGPHPVSGKEFFVCSIVNNEYISCFKNKDNNIQGFPTRVLAEKECKNISSDKKFYIIKKSNLLRISQKPLLWKKQYDKKVKEIVSYNRNLKYSLEDKDFKKEVIKSLYDKGKLNLPEKNCPYYLIGKELLNSVK